jgi:hypothetical protein
MHWDVQVFVHLQVSTGLAVMSYLAVSAFGTSKGRWKARSLRWRGGLTLQDDVAAARGRR